MDFPMFHLDWLNDRFLIAIIAILHEIINHGLAVGFIPYIVWLERKGVKKASSNEITDASWDDLVYKKMKIAFIITTTVGAMTGVGIWFSAALISPTSIGSLIRVFYWAWFIEWLVFVTEVVLILIYFLTWKSSNKSLKSKIKHINFGWFLAIFSWITMAIIVAILGFMMDPGNWNADQNLVNGLTNPIYLPQLMFRTPVALLVAGVFGMLLTTILVNKQDKNRDSMLRNAGQWVLTMVPFAVLGAIYYWKVMPAAMKANMSTAVGTIEFAQYYDLLRYFIVGACSTALLVGILAVVKASKVKSIYVFVACLGVFGFLGIFERVREFIRKPYIIGEYMYSNLLRVEDYPLYQRDGILKYATYSAIETITEDNKLIAGKEVFMNTCSRCHTTQGVNGITKVFERMYGENKPFDEQAMKVYVKNMHSARTYMPPFPGNDEELAALVAYIKNLQVTGETLEGVQGSGIAISPINNAKKVAETNSKIAQTPSLSQK